MSKNGGLTKHMKKGLLGVTEISETRESYLYCSKANCKAFLCSSTSDCGERMVM
jgi:hypothetical protein